MSGLSFDTKAAMVMNNWNIHQNHNSDVPFYKILLSYLKIEEYGYDESEIIDRKAELFDHVCPLYVLDLYLSQSGSSSILELDGKIYKLVATEVTPDSIGNSNSQEEATEDLSYAEQVQTYEQHYGRWVDRINETLIGKPIKARGFGGEEDPNHKNEWAVPKGYLPYTMTQDEDTGEWLSEKKNDTTWYKFEEIDKALEARNAYIKTHNDSKHGIAFVIGYKGIQLRKNTKGIVYYNKNDHARLWELAIIFESTD